MNELNTTISFLEDYVLQYKPVKWVTKSVLTTKDIYIHRYALKRLDSNPELIDYIASIILNQAKSGKRFRRVDCLKVLKSLKRNLPNYDGTRTP